MDFQERLELKGLTLQVVALARRVGDFIRQSRTGFQTSSMERKNPHDYVTYVDKASERILVRELSALLPGSGFIAEEGSAFWQGEPYCWVVDPLDGTTNFIHDMGYYCVSIALRTRGELLLGVVYDPCRNECFYAWKGGGAFMSGAPIRVSSQPSLEEAMVVAELPYNIEDYRACGLNLVSSFMGRAMGIRMIGSAALAICYVAAGRIDAWAECFIKGWDYSAAALILREAGGKVTDFYGNGDIMDTVHIVATNHHLHDEILEILSKSMPRGI